MPTEIDTRPATRHDDLQGRSSDGLEIAPGCGNETRVIPLIRLPAAAVILDKKWRDMAHDLAQAGDPSARPDPFYLDVPASEHALADSRMTALIPAIAQPDSRGLLPDLSIV
ncbi:MAG: hypothetical protein D6800_06080, partial [Candidatus Zixiibacteriota bacterium]